MARRPKKREIKHDFELTRHDLDQHPVWSVLDPLALEAERPRGFDEASVPVSPHVHGDEFLALLVSAEIDLPDGKLLPGALMTEIRVLPGADPPAPELHLLEPYLRLGRAGVLSRGVRDALARDLPDYEAMFPMKFWADPEALGGRFKEVRGTLSLV